MARLAVISDIHGNLEAFRAVLSDLEAQGAQATVCLGDCVGYGPDPEECVNTLRRRKIPTSKGNHEQGLADARGLGWFNPQVRQALVRARSLVTPENLDWMADLPEILVRDGCRFVHGCPPRDLRTYLFELGSAELAHRFTTFPEALCFVGHTHELALVSFDGKTIRRRDLPQGPLTLDPAERHIVNVGSVGQPRDGDNRAKYVLWDPDSRLLDVRFVPYDIRTTADKIRALGFPAIYADRLG